MDIMSIFASSVFTQGVSDADMYLLIRRLLDVYLLRSNFANLTLLEDTAMWRPW